MIGAVGALALGRLMRRFLFQVEPQDPVTLGAAAAILVAAALLACWVPAHRAASIEPMRALRIE